MATYDTSAYDNAIKAYEEKMKADAEAAKKKKNASYDKQAKQAYISSVQNQRALQNNLNQRGIRGGASESSLLKQQAAYQNTRNDIESYRQSALSDIDKDAADKIFDYTTTNEAAKQSYIQSREAEDRQINEYKRQEAIAAKQQDETRYAATISRYNTVAKVDAEINAINALKTSNPAAYNENAWKIAYLQAQRAVLGAK